MADPIDRVASAVSNGESVDWVREKSRRPHLLESLEQLAIVDRIRRTHRAADAGDGTVTQDELGDDTREMPSVPPAQTAPLFRWGRLEVCEKVGEGSGGEVFRARDPGLNAEVALKLLNPAYADSPQLVQKFLDEARQLARVRHHNVVVVHGADQHDGRAGLWTEFIHGESLEKRIQEQGALGPCEAALIGLDLCRALAAVHAAGMIHRDVKTMNVMRENGGRIVLMDFGSVTEFHGMGAHAWSAGVQGTPVCMAPEQLRGEVAGPPTDLYGLGVLLYRLVTKRFPVEASSMNELREKHRSGQQVPLRDRRADLPLEFVQVVERALRLSPSDRFATVGSMEQALAVTLGSMARSEERRRRFQGVAFASIAVVAVVAGVILGRQIFGPTQGPRLEPQLHAAAGAPAPAPLTADVKLMRRTGEQEAPVGPGTRVAPGDQLSLLIRNSDSMYVYVLNEDAVGEVNGLYPIPGLQPANPLQARMEHRLPGDLGGEVVYWNVTSAGGRESIVAIGSRTPLRELEAAIADFPVATPGKPIRFGRVDPMALRTLRGLGSGSTLPPPAGEAKRRLDAAVAALAETGRQTGDVWVWSIELENPPARH